MEQLNTFNSIWQSGSSATIPRSHHWNVLKFSKDDDGYKYKYEGGSFILRMILRKKTMIDVTGSQEDIDSSNEFRIWCDEKNRPKIIKAFNHLPKLFGAPAPLTF